MLATVHTGGGVLFAAVFVACAVEMVEALTIVVAVGVARGWRWALWGAAAAVVVLGAGVAAVGPAVVHWVPIDALRVVIGVALLVVGFNWLRKAVLRAAGRKAKHDEDAIFAETVSELEAEPTPTGPDWPAFVVAFKGVFLEGLEVVIIVLTLGTASHDLSLAAVAAAAALLIVGVVGAVVARQLSGVPENAMKMVVGVMLVSFGTFWVAEGLGLHWPGSDLALLALLAFYAGAAWVAVVALGGAVRRSAA
ncbi:MAG: COG4280 domain-containing protein [Acidimicrobiales bacterium]